MKSSRIQNTTSGIKRNKKHSASVISDDYLAAIKKFPLRAIKTEKENREALEILAELMHATNRGNISPGEDMYMEALMILIEEFESKTYKFEDPSPVEILQFLMEQNELRQVDLVPEIFETQSIVSDVLRGKKKMTMEHVKRLAERFKVSIELFC